MLNYVRQVAICESVQKTIRRALAESDDLSLRMKTSQIPTTDGILRTVSLTPGVDTEEKLKVFMMEHALGSLRLTPSQREHLDLND